MRRRCSALCFGVLLTSGACDRTHVLLEPVEDAGSDAHDPVDAQADAGDPPYFNDGGVYMCGERICACSDGQDNEPVPDGLVDGFDPECTGPYDDDEASFATGEKDGNPRCLDCFFDGNPSSADDDCRIPTSCRDFGDNSGGFGMCDGCTPSEACLNSQCLERTPNGCDCFGCCQIEFDMQSASIRLKESCSMKDLADPIKCPRCVLNMEYDPATSTGPCFNPCGRCELCAGKTSVPEDCGGGGLEYDCEDAQVCGGPSAACGTLAWCIQGCCAPILL